MDSNTFLNLLLASISHDPLIQKPAEQHLVQLESNDIPTYYNSIIGVLSNTTIPENARLMALIRLRTTVSARDPATQSFLSNRWLSQSEQLRNDLHNVILPQLNSKTTNIRETAALTVADIATIELPHNLWPDLIERLLTVAQTPENESVLGQSSISIIGLICGALSQEVQSLARYTDNILNCIGMSMSGENTDLDLRITATRALSSALKFCHKNFEKPDERQFLMKLICESISLPSNEAMLKDYQSHFKLQEVGWDCLINVVHLYYEHIQDFMGEIFDISFNTINLALTQYSDEEMSQAVRLASIQAIEFWYVVASHEASINEEIQRCRENEEECDLVNFNYTQRSFQRITPTLFNTMMLQGDDIGDDDTADDITILALNCMTHYATVCDIELLKFLIPFAENTINVENWRQRDAACTLLGCLVSSPELGNNLEFQSTFGSLIPILIKHVHDPQPHVCISASWALSQYCAYISPIMFKEQALQALVEQAIKPMFSKCLENTKHTAITLTTTNLCRCLYELCGNIDEDDQSPHPLAGAFHEITTSLLKMSEEHTDKNLLINCCYEAFAQLIVSGACEQSKDLRQLLMILGARLDQSIKAFANESDISGYDIASYRIHTQSLICGAMNSLIGRLPEEVIRELAENLINVFLSVLHSDPAIMQEALRGIESVVYKLQESFGPFSEKVVPEIIAIIDNNQGAAELCTRALVTLGTIISRSGSVLSVNLFDTIVEKIIFTLNSESQNQETKVCAIECIIDLALALNERFAPYLPHIMNTLSDALTFCPTSIHPLADLEFVEFLLSLQIALCNSFDVIILAMCHNNDQRSCVAMKDYMKLSLDCAVTVLNDIESISQSKTAALTLLTTIFDYIPVTNPELIPMIFSSNIANTLRSNSTTGRQKVQQLAMQALRSLSALKP